MTAGGRHTDNGRETDKGLTAAGRIRPRRNPPVHKAAKERNERCGQALAPFSL